MRIVDASALLVAAPRWATVIGAAITALAVAALVNFTPQVSADFFFASDDPALQSSRAVDALFPSRRQVLVSVEGDLRSRAYQARIREFSGALEDLPGVVGVRSLARGPDDLEEALASPLWRPLLIGPAGEDSLIVVLLSDADGDGASLMADVEALAARSDSADFRIRLAGVPYVLESIKRELVRDLGRVNLAGALVAALVLLFAFRSWTLLSGALVSAFAAVSATLVTQSLLGVPLGLLTANVAAIVIVITLTHVVFMAGNRASRNGRSATEAVALTLPASLWAMVTTGLSFLTLLAVGAEPLSQLGAAGALGTVCATVSAYLIFPSYLGAWSPPEPTGVTSTPDPGPVSSVVVAAGLILLALAALGVFRLDNDPSLFEYFDDEGEIGEGLAHFDARGGAGILKLVVADADHGRLDNDDAYRRLWRLHEALADHPAVGVPISLPLLMAEGDRHPLSFLVTWARMLKLMGSQKVDGAARSFITPDHRRALFVVRMIESYSEESRESVLATLEQMPSQFGFELSMSGGIYRLQADLAAQVRGSVFRGVSLLLGIFALVGWLATGSVGVAGLMTLLLGLTAGAVLGLFGWLGVPLGIIAAPGVSISLGVAVDGLIHVARARRRLADWRSAVRDQRRAVVIAAAVVVLGFAVLLLSGFPPNRRFGLAVVLGSAIATWLTLRVLPLIGDLSPRKHGKSS